MHNVKDKLLKIPSPFYLYKQKSIEMQKISRTKVPFQCNSLLSKTFVCFNFILIQLQLRICHGHHLEQELSP